MADVQIRIRDLIKRYGKIDALKGFTFETSGDWGCLGVLGRNGAGKTTLLRALVGMLPFDSGILEVEVDGKKWSHADPRTTVFIAERQTLAESLTGWQHLRVYEGLNALIDVAVDADLRMKLIEGFGLEEHLDKPVSKMSKGTRRKVELVAAVSSEVPLVVADELAEGVDVPSMYAFEKVIREGVAGGKHFIVSSHNVGFLSEACDVLAVVDEGRCVDTFRLTRGESNIKERVLAAFGCFSEDQTEEIKSKG